jgi:hypothetical protein
MEKLKDQLQLHQFLQVRWLGFTYVCSEHDNKIVRLLFACLTDTCVIFCLCEMNFGLISE